MLESSLAIFAVYFALPAVLALVVLRLRHFMAGWLRQVLGIVMLPWVIVMGIAGLHAGSLIPACVVAIGVVAFVAWRLLTRR